LNPINTYPPLLFNRAETAYLIGVYRSVKVYW